MLLFVFIKINFKLFYYKNDLKLEIFKNINFIISIDRFLKRSIGKIFFAETTNKMLCYFLFYCLNNDQKLDNFTKTNKKINLLQKLSKSLTFTLTKLCQCLKIVC